MRIRKSGCVELDRTYCCTGKFNIALSLCRILEITLYFFKYFLEIAAEESAVAAALQPLGVTMVCFLEQESILQSLAPQQRYKLFSSCFLYLSLVNLPLLASLKERSTHRELGCFLKAEDRDSLEDDLLDKATKNVFVLFWKAVALLVVEVFSYFQK